MSVSCRVLHITITYIYGNKVAVIDFVDHTLGFDALAED